MIPARLFGDGPERVVALHGWMADHRIFEPLAQYVEPSGFTCALLDCRGYGTRYDEPPPYTIRAMAEDVLAAAGHLGWDSFHILGHSMGGMVAQRLMVDAPERLRSAILVAPVPAWGARVESARRHMLLRAVQDSHARRALIRANAGTLRKGSIEVLLKLSMQSANPEAMQPYIDAWSDTDFAADLVDNGLPVLAVCGALDPAVPIAVVQRLTEAWRSASVAVIQSSGHYPMYEAPAELAQIVQTFLAGFGTRS